MTKEEFAKKLDGREVGKEMDAGDEYIAKDSGLIVIFGASDDLAEIRGYVHDEVSVYEGGVIPFYKGKLLTKECDNDDCPHEERQLEKAKLVHAVWDEGDEAVWTYKTEIPHATFFIKEAGGNYCQGIVFDKKDIE